MNYLLDSNTVSDFYDKDSHHYPQIAQRLKLLTTDDHVFLSILTLYELEYGYNKAPEDKKSVIRKKIEEAKEDFSILALTEEGSIHFGRLKTSLVEKRNLKKENSKKHNIDIMIAGTAILYSCTLVSADGIYVDLKKEEPLLEVENWNK